MAKKKRRNINPNNSTKFYNQSIDYILGYYGADDSIDKLFKYGSDLEYQLRQEFDLLLPELKAVVAGEIRVLDNQNNIQMYHPPELDAPASAAIENFINYATHPNRIAENWDLREANARSNYISAARSKLIGVSTPKRKRRPPNEVRGRKPR